MKRFGPERRAEPFLIMAVIGLVAVLLFNLALAVWALIELLL